MKLKLRSAIFYVLNAQTALPFYTDKLGFTVIENYPDYISLKLDKMDFVTLSLNSADDSEKIPGHGCIYVDVDEIEVLYNQLKSKGVMPFEELTTLDWGSTFSIKDPEGNKIGFIGEKH